MGGWAPPGPRRGYATAMPHRQVLPPKATSSLSQSSSPAQRELPQNSEAASLLPLSNRAAPRSAGAPPEAASSLRPWSSPAAQRELPQKHQPPPSLNRAAALRSGSSPRSSHFSPSMEQPRRAAGAPPEASASSLSQSSSSPAQRELPQKQPHPSLNRAAAPRSGSSPQKQPLLSVYGAAPRRGSSPRRSFLPPSISSMEQPLAAGAPPEAASSLYGAAPCSGSSPKSSLFSPSIDLSSSPAQRELPQKQPPPSLNRAAALRSGSSPRSSLFSPSIEQPREFTKRAETASSLSQLSSPAQREPGGGSSLPKLLPSSSSGPPSLSHLHLEVLEHSVWVRSTDAHSRVRLSKEGTAFHMHHSS